MKNISILQLLCVGVIYTGVQKNNFRKILLFLLLNLSMFQTYSQVKDTRKSFIIYTDEDFKPVQVFGKANDQNYTMGIGFGLNLPSFAGSWVFAPNELIFKSILSKRFLEKDSLVLLSPGLSINGTAFTPLDLRRSDVVQGDRPYAFLLSLSTKEMLLDLKHDQMFTSEFSYGVLGTKIGQAFQTWMHKSVIKDTANTPIPQGWDNQISKGGEPTFLYSISYDKLISAISPRGTRSLLEVKWGLQGMVGYYTGVAAQLSARFGLLDRSNWMANYSQLQNMNGITPTQQKTKSELFLFGMIRPVYLAYNELLNGGFRNSVYTLDFSQTNQAKLEWNFGVGFTFPLGKSKTKSLIFNWIMNAGRTSELNTPYRRSHQWGTWNFAYNFGSGE